MNCHIFEADVVDLARGADLSIAIKQQVSKHLEHCASCADRFARERDLTVALKTLAGASPQLLRSAVVEQRLLRAFAEQHTSVRAQGSAPLTASASSRVAVAPAACRWLAAAAVVILAATLGLNPGWWRTAGDAKPAATSAATTMATPAAAGPAAAGLGPVASAPARASRADAGISRSTQPSRGLRSAVNRNETGATNGSLRFVALPAAASLPRLESGRIVRLQLPMAILRSCGFDVVPEAASRLVEADVLVGQDGEPRAIRLVDPDSDSRRKQ